MTTAYHHDRDLHFEDWGVSVTYRQVTATYTPASQQVTETHSETSITAIVSPTPATVSPNTAGQHAVSEIEFLVKTEDLPDVEPVMTSQVVYQSNEYDIVSFSQSADGLVTSLLCRSHT